MRVDSPCKSVVANAFTICTYINEFDQPEYQSEKTLEAFH